MGWTDGTADEKIGVGSADGERGSQVRGCMDEREVRAKEAIYCGYGTRGFCGKGV